MKTSLKIAIIGSGPAGLMAAEKLSGHGHDITVYERKKSAARKFLMAGRGGLNLTHSENFENFVKRYHAAADSIRPALEKFMPSQLVKWAEDLGEPSFIGSSGRIFPKSFKASPLLRAWLARLSDAGVKLQFDQNWSGWGSDGSLLLNNEKVKADIVILALGGASWPKLGSDGSWVSILEKRNIQVLPLKPANCGFDVEWSNLFKEKFSGHPLKSISVSLDGHTVHGEIMIDFKGIEGGAIYALSRSIRDKIDLEEQAIITLDLKPNISEEEIIKRLKNRKRQSFSTFMQATLGLSSLAIHLLREADLKVSDYAPERLAQMIKSVPLNTTSAFSIEKSISSAGGIHLQEISSDFMLKKLPGVFVAGEMLDWEAPTGGYLLQACFATGFSAGQGALSYARKL